MLSAGFKSRIEYPVLPLWEEGHVFVVHDRDDVIGCRSRAIFCDVFVMSQDCYKSQLLPHGKDVVSRLLKSCYVFYTGEML